MPRKKASLYENEAGLLDLIYLEMSDSLRALRLDRLSLDEQISEYLAILKDLESKNDPNRNLFHVATSNEMVSECDNIRVKIHETEEAINKKDQEITEFENKLEALHTARKVMLKAKTLEAKESESLPEPVLPSSGEAVESLPENQQSTLETDISKKERNMIRRKLNTCLDGLELASRVTGFDPERARVELEEVISKINEILAGM